MQKQKALRRILLKVSGEAFVDQEKKSFSVKSYDHFASLLKELVDEGKKIALVLGGGNVFRGINAQKENIDRVLADQIGMVGTMINALFLLDRLQKLGVKVKALSAIGIEKIFETYQPFQAKEYFEKNDLLLLPGGTGNPYFSTDSAAALRALELQVDILLKATKVDGIYDKDPKIDKDAKKIESISYREYLSRELKVMDLSAVALCQEGNVPVRIFDFFQKDSLQLAIKGEKIGSLISGE